METRATAATVGTGEWFALADQSVPDVLLTLATEADHNSRTRQWADTLVSLVTGVPGPDRFPAWVLRRSLPGVGSTHSTETTALWTRVNLALARMEVPDTKGDTRRYRSRGCALAEQLADHNVPEYQAFCCPSSGLTQQTGAPANKPHIVETALAVDALLDATTVDPAYGDLASSAATFATSELAYRETSQGAVLDAYPNQDDAHVTPAWTAMAAQLFIGLSAYEGTGRWRRQATALLASVRQYQSAAGGWYYREPPATARWSQYHTHNALILRALCRYRAVFDSDRYDDVIDDALGFYDSQLVTDTGMPTADELSTGPQTLRACATAVLAFVAADRLQRARAVVRWTLRHRYESDSGFTTDSGDRSTVSPAGRAWMAYALSEYVTAVRDEYGGE